MRVHIGPGYRIYFGKEGKKIVLLLLGGDKKGQGKDIQKAEKYWKDYLTPQLGKNYEKNKKL